MKWYGSCGHVMSWQLYELFEYVWLENRVVRKCHDFHTKYFVRFTPCCEATNSMWLGDKIGTKSVRENTVEVLVEIKVQIKLH